METIIQDLRVSYQRLFAYNSIVLHIATKELPRVINNRLEREVRNGYPNVQEFHLPLLHSEYCALSHPEKNERWDPRNLFIETLDEVHECVDHCIMHEQQTGSKMDPRTHHR